VRERGAIGREDRSCEPPERKEESPESLPVNTSSGRGLKPSRMLPRTEEYGVTGRCSDNKRGREVKKGGSTVQPSASGMQSESQSQYRVPFSEKSHSANIGTASDAGGNLVKVSKKGGRREKKGEEKQPHRRSWKDTPPGTRLVFRKENQDALVFSEV